MTKNEALMLDLLERAYETLQLENAKREFPLNGLEVEMGELIAKIKGETFDPKAMRKKRNKLKKELGPPVSVRYKQLLGVLYQLVNDHVIKPESTKYF